MSSTVTVKRGEDVRVKGFYDCESCGGPACFNRGNWASGKADLFLPRHTMRQCFAPNCTGNTFRLR